MTKVFEALERGNLALLQAVLEREPDLVHTRGMQGMTPLHMAAMRCHSPAARLLIEAGADVNARKDDGWTPLHSASQNGDQTTVRLLLDNGADPNLWSNRGQNALHAAAYGVSEDTTRILQMGLSLIEGAESLSLDRAAVARLLITRGAALDTRDGIHDGTALHSAVARGHHHVAEALLDCGADPNAVSSKGLTPLHLAAGHCHEALARMLLDNGAKRNAINNNGRTPHDVIGAACDECSADVSTRLHGILSPTEEPGMPSDIRSLDAHRPAQSLNGQASARPRGGPAAGTAGDLPSHRPASETTPRDSAGPGPKAKQQLPSHTDPGEIMAPDPTADVMPTADRVVCDICKIRVTLQRDLVDGKARCRPVDQGAVRCSICGTVACATCADQRRNCATCGSSRLDPLVSE